MVLIGIGDLFLAVREMTLNSRDSVNTDARWLKHDYTGLRIAGWLIIVSGVLATLGGIVMAYFAASSL